MCGDFVPGGVSVRCEARVSDKVLQRRAPGAHVRLMAYSSGETVAPGVLWEGCELGLLPTALPQQMARLFWTDRGSTWLDEITQRMPHGADDWQQGADEAQRTVFWIIHVSSVLIVVRDNPDRIEERGQSREFTGIQRAALFGLVIENEQLITRMKQFLDDVCAVQSLRRHGFRCFAEACVAMLKREAERVERGGRAEVHLVASVMAMVRGILVAQDLAA